MTHTPGPWIFHISPAARYTETLTGASHYDEEYVAVVSSTGTVICDNAQYYSCSLDPNNARLIAAAPELLEVATDLLNYAEMYLDLCDNDSPHAELAIRSATAVIAKATGETE